MDVSLKEILLLYKQQEGHEEGSCGPISWKVDYKILLNDFKSSYVKVDLKFYAADLIDAELNAQNPKAEIVKKKFYGLEISAEVGLDFDCYELYYQFTVSGITIRRPIMYFNFSFATDMDRFKYDIESDSGFKVRIANELSETETTADVFVDAANRLGYHIQKEELLEQIKLEPENRAVSGTVIFVTQILVA